MFETVEREPNLTGRVSSKLETLIMENRLQPGDRLPAVPELAAQYGVSRTVIREAIGALAAKGLLEVRHGSRTVVSRPTAKAVTQSMALYLRAGQPHIDFAKVGQVRRVLEVEIAGLAAEQRTADDVVKLESLLQEMAAIVGKPQEVPADHERLVRNDVNFHTALAEVTHNELFSLLLNSIGDIMLEVRQLGLSVPGAPAYALAAHQAVFEGVRDGDRERARQAMADHLTTSEDLMRQGMAQRQADSTTT